MKSLVIASKPILELTRMSYEVMMETAMMERSITFDQEHRNALSAQIDQLQELIDHVNEVLKNIEQ